MRSAISDSFKARINNYAKSHKLPAQIVLQNYLFERFLARLSVSKYKKNLILKGGLLISSIAGLETRTTKDMDMTLKNLPLTEEKVLGILDEIFDIPLSDNITFRVQSTESIREDDQYGGLRIHVVAQYDIVPVNISIDISTGIFLLTFQQEMQLRPKKRRLSIKRYLTKILYLCTYILWKLY